MELKCNYEYRFRDDFPTYAGETLETVEARLLNDGNIVWWRDLRTVLRTTMYKVHGVYVIVFLDRYGWNLLTGTYNFLCALEGADSTLLQEQIKVSPVLQSDQRWSKWDNPMRDRKEEAWRDMWRSCRSFKEELHLHEYIQTHMKNWDDVGNTLYWSRYGG